MHSECKTGEYQGMGGNLVDGFGCPYKLENVLAFVLSGSLSTSLNCTADADGCKAVVWRTGGEETLNRMCCKGSTCDEIVQGGHEEVWLMR